MALRIRRGTDAERQTIIFAEGELVYTTDTKLLYIGDGTTTGGVLAGGGEGGGGISAIIEDITPQLGGNLDLNENEINGIGDISITGTITADVISSGLFVGDGSGLTNLPSSGVVEGASYQINIVGTDSSVIIDSNTNDITGNLTSNQIFYSQGITFNNTDTNVPGEVRLQNTGDAQYLRFIRTDAGTAPSQNIGLITFDQVDDLGTTTYASLGFWHSGIYIANSPTGEFNSSKYLGFENGNLCVGNFSPEENFRLDVNGDSIFRGKAVLTDGVLEMGESRTLDNIIPSPGTYALTTNINNNTLAFFDGIEWYNLLGSTETDGLTLIPGPITLVGIDEATKNGFGEDSTVLTGTTIYNTTLDRFEFFQAGSWVSLINNGDAIGQILSWNGSDWVGVDPTVTEGTIENANTLNGFSGSFYLDFNNFTNVPTTLAGYGITDAVNIDELGSFAFTGNILDTQDSSTITVIPAVTFNSDVSIENNLNVTNKITVDTIEVANIITTPTDGTPEISSDGAILLTAATRVEVSSSPLKMANFTTAERDVLSAENGDMIYNTTTNKFQGYANGVWVDLH